MNEAKRRFFSGDTLQQALVQAANYFNLDPEQVAYRSIEKKHGFLKVRRRVVIEVDPDAPRQERRPIPPPTVPVAPVMPAAAPARVPAPAPEASSVEMPSAAPREEETERRVESPRPAPPREGRERGGDRGRERGRGRGPERGDRDRGARGDRADRGDRGDRGRGPREGGEGSRERRRPSWQDSPRPRREAADASPGAPSVEPREGLVTLPERPLRSSERFPAAQGPMAEAAGKATDLLLRIAGLDLEARVLQGEERLEIDLSGEDVDWCFADDGEFLMAAEHLLPRMIRSLAGEAAPVRVDCDNFHDIREERLRSLAQQMAEEVRRLRRPRTLEPMNPADRRIVHVTLADDPGVETESDGDGYFKRVTIRPV